MKYTSQITDNLDRQTLVSLFCVVNVLKSSNIVYIEVASETNLGMFIWRPQNTKTTFFHIYIVLYYKIKKNLNFKF